MKNACGAQGRLASPHSITLADDGSRVLYLRSSGPDDPTVRLWALDLRTGSETPLTDQNIDRYATDAAAHVVAAVSDGHLLRVRLRDDDSPPQGRLPPPQGHLPPLQGPPPRGLPPVRKLPPPRGAPRLRGHVERLPVEGPVRDPRPDPTGRRLAYLTRGTLRVIDEHGADILLAGEQPVSRTPGAGSTVVWGEPDPAAVGVFRRRRGYWWAPDGERILALRVEPSGDPAAGGRPPAVSLHLLDLDGSWVDVRWDRLTYPHLAAVAWDGPGGPLVTVLPRVQHHALVLAVDVRTGDTQVHAELDDPRWVTVTAGTPAYLPDGRVVLGGELNLDTVDTHSLFADGALLTPPWLHARRLCGQTPGSARLREGAVDLIVEGSEGEPSEQHVYRLRLTSRSASPEVSRLTPAPGWHCGHVAGGTLVISAHSLDHSGARVTVYHDGGACELPSYAPVEPAPRPALLRVTDRRLPCGVLYPADHVAGRRLPVLLEVAAAPARQAVVASREAWRRRQWWADHGYAVVVVDGRGAAGVSPTFEKVIHRRVWDLTLTDQTEALAAAANKHPDLDLGRVAVRGAGFGGSIAVAGVLRLPEIFAAAVAESPAVDWSMLPTVYAERYLGLPEENPEAYARHDLTTEAGELSRPLLLVRPKSGGQARHVARFAAAVRAAGDDTGARLAEITAARITREVLEQEMRFLARALPTGH